MIRSKRSYVSQAGEYYSIPRTEKQIKDAGEELASHIPKSYNRQRREAKESGSFAYAMKYRRAVKTPYKPGDKIAYLVNENMGYGRFPDIIRAVRFEEVAKITEKTVVTDWGKRISKEFIVGKVKKG